MGKVFVIVLIIIAIVFICWVALSFLPHETDQVKLPDNEEAKYSFHIENTGGLILASEFDQYGKLLWQWKINSVS